MKNAGIKKKIEDLKFKIKSQLNWKKKKTLFVYMKDYVADA